MMKTPDIRFHEFNESWDTCLLSEYLEVSNKKNNDDTYGKQDVLSVSGDYGIVNQIDFLGRSYAGASVSNYGVVNKGDVVYTKSPLNSNPYGIIKTNKGNTGIVSTLYAVYHPKENVDSSFVQTYFEQNSRMNNYMHPLVNKGAKNDMKVSSENALKGNVVFPKIDEQRKIVGIFSAIDTQIIYQQRKLNTLRNNKKAMLVKMFPQNGQIVPEIRFNGFSGDWELRKFSDLVQRESALQRSSFNYPSVEYEDVIVEEGRLNKDVRKKETQKTGIAFNGTQVLYGKLRPYLHNWLNPDFAGVAVGDWWVLRPVGIDKKFLYRLIQTQQFDDVANQSSGSKMPRADWNNVSNTEFVIPSSFDEQRQIAETFDNLDNLITFNQRKLDKLKDLKQAMLNKMFVKGGN